MSAFEGLLSAVNPRVLGQVGCLGRSVAATREITLRRAASTRQDSESASSGCRLQRNFKNGAVRKTRLPLHRQRCTPCDVWHQYGSTCGELDVHCRPLRSHSPHKGTCVACLRCASASAPRHTGAAWLHRRLEIPPTVDQLGAFRTGKSLRVRRRKGWELVCDLQPSTGHLNFFPSGADSSHTMVSLLFFFGAVFFAAARPRPALGFLAPRPET